MVDVPAPAPTARARARIAMTDDIKAIARRHCAEHGAEGLSLRAVARELGVVSSAVYRYVSSRDELLTMLIVDAFDAVGEAAEAASTAAQGVEARWQGIARAVRSWAIAHPHDYALIYGTPVAGYAAPRDTVDPAMRATVALLRVVADAASAGELQLRGAPSSGAAATNFARIRAELALEVPDEALGRALAAWTWLLGHVSYELFGHLAGADLDLEALFEHQLELATRALVGG